MKKGDIIGRTQELKVGAVLLRNLASQALAEAAFSSVQELYRIDIEMNVLQDIDNPGAFSVCAAVPVILTQSARVNWVVDYEVGVVHLDTGGGEVIDLREQTDWVILQESSPEYQDSVEHMTDEQLRESIEQLRGQRISRPEATRTRVSSPKAPKQTEEERKLGAVLNSMSPEQKLELQRKLGLIE
jgi:hypothetical protein